MDVNIKEEELFKLLLIMNMLNKNGFDIIIQYNDVKTYLSQPKNDWSVINTLTEYCL